jgi:dihydrofolate reductase
MRRLIMWNVVTLEGFFEGPESWDLAWHKHAWGDELERFSMEQLQAASALLFGRVTYQGMAQYWTSQQGEIADFMNNLPKVVFSRTLQKAEWKNTALVKDHAEDEAAKLKQQPGKDMFIFGSAALSSALMQHNLIDEYRFCIAPVILGRGHPLFKDSSGTIAMKLLEARQLKNGSVITRYQPENAPAKPE